MYFLVFCKQVDIFHDAQIVDNLVGNVLHQFLGIGQANHFFVVVHADVDATAMRIGEAAYPFQIFVSPRLLVFCQQNV